MRAPIGKCVQFMFQDGCRLIVGVVSSVRNEILRRPSDHGDYDMAFYVPVEQWWLADKLLIRTRSDPGPVINDIRGLLQAADPATPYVNLRRLSDYRDQQTHGWLVASSLFGIFAILGLVLATVGTYAVLVAIARQRIAEIGIRMALGASPPQIRFLMLRTGMIPVAVGIVIGVLGGTVAARVMEGLFFGVRSADAMGLAGTVLLLAAVGAFACLKPAHDAADIDPATLLRAE